MWAMFLPWRLSALQRAGPSLLNFSDFSGVAKVLLGIFSCITLLLNQLPEGWGWRRVPV